MIVGFSVNSIQSERRRIPKGRINISSIPKIVEVEKKRINSPQFREALSMRFVFTTAYEPNIGEIRIEGEILYAEKNIEDILKMWMSTGKLPQDTEIEVKNFLLRRCLTIGLYLSENLQLPPPFMFPQIKPKKHVDEDKMRYIG